MKALMEGLRANRPEVLGGLKVVAFADYRESVSVDLVSGESTTIHLPKSNVLSYKLEGNNGIIIRPSGTEPKIKFYYLLEGADRAECEAKCKAYQQTLNEMV